MDSLHVMVQLEMGQYQNFQTLGLHFPQHYFHVETMYLPNGIIHHVCPQLRDLQEDITKGGLDYVEFISHSLC